MFDLKVSKNNEVPGLPEGEFQPLSTLKRGQSAVILEVHGQDGAAQQRMMEMGFIPGAHVVVFNTGDPMLIALNGNRIGMGRSLLREISVIVLD